MKWQAKEIDLYLQAKEYVDTAIIPLIPISWANGDVKPTVAMGEFISIITMEIERQFQGRVIQFPPFTYIRGEELSLRTTRIQEWSKDLLEGGMKYLFFLTSDSEWKPIEQQLEGPLIWLPTIPLEHLDMTYKREIIDEQVKQVIPLLINKWQEI